nr:membrane protein insertase YidC [Thermoanaerobaculia bacterium]
MESRRLLLAVALSMAILLVWGWLFPPKKPAAVAPPTATSTPLSAVPSPQSPSSPSVPAPGPQATEQPIQGEREEELSLSQGASVATFSTRGAQLVSFRAPDQGHTDATTIELVKKLGGPLHPFGLVDSRGGSLPLNNALFVASKEDREGQPELVFRYRGPEGSAEKRFRFAPNGLLELEVKVEGVNGWQVFFGPGVGNHSQEELDSRYSTRSAVYQVAGRTDRVDGKSAKVAKSLAGTGLGWSGLDDNYFLAAVLPDSSTGGVVIEPYLIDSAAGGGIQPMPADGELSDAQKALPRDLALRFAPAEPSFRASAYFGGKRYEMLERLPRGLESTINLGTFWFLARPLMLGLEWIYDHVVANYGWAIVLMTMLIKLLMVPLTHKTMVSMGKMQELNPKVMAIRSRYAGKLKDRQGRPNLEMQRAMNEEVMGLYRSEGVNPAGGCLPMLLQLPVFFAYFKILSVSFDLRHAPWLGWVQDLSAHDPFYVLPIVMGGTQFLQTWMTPSSSAQPMQRQLMMA